ncbi:hypothetical protein [Bradyrhizobium betae]|uniref:Uncharacterized protein n=1 Tax=Bradyrhizobium betae TaxID=244734 RepID=A0A5P6P2N3_9BRAD|nr:hypothetical protein [Bradyrhizobium betae]MCS3728736.1 hypothetical protein [Bradyrhizobium betae]QFI72617.1 hypothetical protein F8237_09590 [Bradyrhizobium betae]
MSLAISLIVDGYVRLADRDALETLRAHRAKMLEAATAVAEMDTSGMIATLNEDIEIIDAGLSRLKAWREEQERASGRPEATPLNDIARGDPHE